MFFARYEVSRLGATEIGAEHLLLGLMHEPKGVLSRVLATLPSENIRSDIESQSRFRERIPTSVEVPFTAECKRVLNVAAEEADRLLHSHIGPEHLLLALMREETSIAGGTVAKYGLRLEDVRIQIVQMLGEKQGTSSRLEAFDQIDQIKRLVEQLGRTPSDTKGSNDLVGRIGDALDALRHHLDPSS